MNPDWVSIYVLETEALVRTSLERWLEDHKEKIMETILKDALLREWMALIGKEGNS